MKQKFKNFFGNSRLRYGTIATCITILVILAVFLLNWGIDLLSDKVNLSLDLTDNKAYTLTDESKDYIQSLDKDVTIIVTSKEEDFTALGDYFIQTNEFLKQYARLSDKIDLKYIDLKENPTYFDSFPNLDLQAHSIFISSGDNHTLIEAEDLFNIESSYYSASGTIVSSKAEQELTSAILSVCSEEKIKVSLLSGYDEESCQYFVNLLEKNNYEVNTQAILTEEINNDANMVIIFAPQRDYDPSAIEKLNKFIENGGNFGKTILYVPSLNLIESPNLDLFFEQYGIKVDDGIVYEPSTNYRLAMNNPFYTICEYADTEYSSQLKNSSIPVCLPYCRAIDVLDESNVSILLQFSESSCVLPSNADENWTPDDSPKTGSIPGMAIAKKVDETSNNSTNIITCGSALSFDYNILSQNALNNSAYFLNVINSLNDNDNGIVIETKTINEQALNMNATQAIVISIVFALLLPIVIAAIGIVVCVNRKRK